MKVQQRSYRGEADKPLMLALAHTRPEDNLHVVDLPYRLSSEAFDTPENVGLWVDEAGDLAAWAVLQSPFWAIDSAVHPDAPDDMHRRLLAWADERARAARGTPSGHPMWFVNVFQRQEKRRHDLEAAGFADQGDVGENPWSKVFLKRPAGPVPAPVLPEGFSIRPLVGVSELAAYVALHQAAFGSEAMTEPWRRRVIERPEYVPGLDLVAAGPDGSLAAFCVCWFDPAGRGGHPSGQIEPLGVGPAFRHLGLGRALLWEELRRLQNLGAERVYVETDNQRDAALSLYQSVGFHVIENVRVYRKEYPGDAGDV